MAFCSETMNTLSPAALAAHRAELATQGFTVLTDALSERQISQSRAALEDRIRRFPHLNGTGESYSGVNMTNDAPIFRELAQHPALLSLLESELGSDCILSGANYGCVLPGAGKGPMHRDTDIWGPSLPWLPVPVGINTAYVLDAYTEEIGATRCVAGSHLRPEASIDEPSIPMLAPEGAIVAFDGRLLHQAGANRTQQLRRTALFFYVRSWVKPQTDHKRSTSREVVESASPTLLRLLGFERQSPVEHPDGRSEIVPAPGATSFYGK